jgi:uncharacterized protein YukE
MTDPIPHINWPGYVLQDKFNMTHTGPGASAATAAAQAMAELAPQFAESATRVQSILASVGVSWQGEAATAFTQVMQQMGQWAEQSSPTSQKGGNHIQTYASSYDTAKNSIPNPAELRPVGSESGWGLAADVTGGVLKNQFGTTFGVQSDYSKRLAALQAANDQANRALTAHEQATRDAIAQFPTITPAPQIPNNNDPAVKPHTTTPPNTTDHTHNTPPGTTTHQPGGNNPTPPGTNNQNNTNNNQNPSVTPMTPPHTAPSNYTPPPPAPTNTNPTNTVPGNFGPGGFGSNNPSPHSPGSGSRWTPPPLPPGYHDPLYNNNPRYNPRPQPSPTRTPGQTPREAEAAQGLSGQGAAAEAKPGGAGPMPPGGMGGGRGGAEEKRHRNNTYIPSDDPFHIEFEDYVDCVPPVIGLNWDNQDDDYYRG